MSLTNQLITEDLPIEPFAAALTEDKSDLRPDQPRLSSPRLQIDLLLARTEPRAIREIVSPVFEDLLRLLECLDLIEGHLRKVDQARETFALFQMIHDDARSLVEFIQKRALAADSITEILAETLDGITFAINHDLKRIFESGLDGPSSDEPAVVVIGKLIRNHDVLTNCLQQSAITLAIVFDPTLVGAKLFNNSDVRQKESVQLAKDLTELVELMACFEAKMDESARRSMVREITKFHSQSLQFLMYTDWPVFENLCERVMSSMEDLQKLQSVIHPFRTYLETLLGFVKMRAVLVETEPSPATSEIAALANSLVAVLPPENSGPDNGVEELAA